MEKIEPLAAARALWAGFKVEIDALDFGARKVFQLAGREGYRDVTEETASAVRKKLEMVETIIAALEQP